LVGTDLSDLPANLFEEWQAAWEQHAAHALDVFRASAPVRHMEVWQPPHGARDDKLYGVWEGVRLELERFTTSETTDTRIKALQDLAASIKLNVGSKGAWGGDEALTAAKDLLRGIRQAALDVVDDIGTPPNDLDREAARLLPHWLELARRVQALFRAMKQHEGLLDFDDLEHRARVLLTTNEHVRARYQGREFKHLLVDEFQDTNEAQWDIVRALADPTQPGALFIVGDEKQSIYSFRGADVRVFGKARETIKNAEGQEVLLTESFRTHKPLVDGFNSLFDNLLKRLAARHYEVAFGAPMSAFRHAPPHDAPSMELLLIERSLLPEDDRSTEMARRWEAYEIANKLRAMVEGQMLIYDKEERRERPVTYGDMAILFQSTTRVMLYEEIFKALDLPFVTVAGRGYYDRQEVWDVINLLTALHNPADNLALAAALRSPLFSLSDEALLALRLQKDDDSNPLSLWEALNFTANAQSTQSENMNGYLPIDEIRVVEFARNVLYHLKHIAGRVTISELLREALALTGYLATLSGLPDGARKRANVEKLLDKAQATGQVTLGAFQQYLTDLSAREVREGEATLEASGAVTIMTVHASKGLEFPVVVLPDASWDKGNMGSDLLLYDEGVLACKVFDEAENKFVPSYPYRRLQAEAKLREEAERKRLLYVAATRAQDMLVISGQYNVTKAGKVSDTGLWLTWLLEALELAAWNAGITDKAYGWGTLRIHCPNVIPPKEALVVGGDEAESAWDSAAIRDGQPLAGDTTAPPLMGKIRITRDRRARNLSATHIADLGAAQYDEYSRQKLQRALRHDAPASVDQISERNPRVSDRILGNIVHEALRWWRFPTADNNLEDLLQNYAWEQGIINAQDRLFAVDRARGWLLDIRREALYQLVESAQQVFRELPFIYQTDKRTIHGVIDLLFQSPEGLWTLVDYKTSYVEGGGAANPIPLLKAHAKRYHLQIGVYAEAVRSQIGGQTPRAMIHYLRYRRSIDISSEEWRPALARLEEHIGSFIWEEDDVE
jgi:ATP-dependent helicase/nuclease subunit A